MREMGSSRRADATPHAAALIEGLRDIGYSLETAISDIIDNSITAGAHRIEIVTETYSDEPYIAIIDDGVGMTEQELVSAMRPGSRNPLATRDEPDLGRFGLGLKSASFSQCRRLTVVSRKTGQASAAIWDLDDVPSRCTASCINNRHRLCMCVSPILMPPSPSRRAPSSRACG